MGRRGDKKHLKRLAAPKPWMLDKLSGVWATRPSQGPHKLRECLPLTLILRNRLKYALTGAEVQKILMNRLVRVDSKVRKNPKYPAGFMDVISINKTGEDFRVIYDVKGRFKLVKIGKSEAGFKLCKVTKSAVGRGGIPYIVTHDSRTVRFPDPSINVGDTVKFNIATGQVTEFVPMEQGALVMITKGRNTGRVGTVRRLEKHPGSYNICHIIDANGHVFATRLANAFVIGRDEPMVTIPKANGVKMSIIEESQKRLRRRR